MNRLASFFNYKEENTDCGYEAAQDFFLSWTLRCAKEDFKKDNYLINHYSKRILFSLLYGQITESKFEIDFSRFNSFAVLEITTKRQFRGIDLLAKVKVQFDGITQDFILNIENKWYTFIGENQLKDYIHVVEQHFDLTNTKLVSVVVFCDYEGLSRNTKQVELCKHHNYLFTNIEELSVCAQMHELGITGNDLFDVYWFGDSSIRGTKSQNQKPI